MIYLASDLHLVKYKDGYVYINQETFNTMMKWEPITESDQLIYLGDLMDSEINPTYYEAIWNALKSKIEKSSMNIFIRGNNDTLPDSFYKKLGFSKVVFGTRVVINRENILLSHTSVNIERSCDIDFNIHGHIHRPNVDPDGIPYYHFCKNNINLCTKDLRQHRLTCINDINLKVERTRNLMFDPLQTEKPGMSQFIQNKVYDLLENGDY